VKAGDLVKVYPACVGFYVIVAKLKGEFFGGYQMWWLDGNPVQGPLSGMEMSERWMEIVSAA